MWEGARIIFLRRKFFVSQYRKCLKRTLRSFGKLRESIIFLLKLKRRVTIFCRNFFVQQYRRTSYGKASVFQKFFSYSEMTLDKKEGEGKQGISSLLIEKFSLTVPKSFVGDPFSVSVSSGIECSYA